MNLILKINVKQLVLENVLIINVKFQMLLAPKEEEDDYINIIYIFI